MGATKLVSQSCPASLEESLCTPLLGLQPKIFVSHPLLLATPTNLTTAWCTYTYLTIIVITTIMLRFHYAYKLQ